jgi:hypothetical protein
MSAPSQGVTPACCRPGIHFIKHLSAQAVPFKQVAEIENRGLSSGIGLCRLKPANNRKEAIPYKASSMQNH